MTLGSILRRPVLDPLLLRASWTKLSPREQITSARRWRSEAAAVGNLETARVFWRWEQEAKQPRDEMPARIEVQKSVRALESESEEKKESFFPNQNNALEEVSLEIQINRKTPCLSARMLQIANRLKRCGVLHSLDRDEIEGKIRWTGNLSLTEAVLDALLQKSEGVLHWQRINLMKSSKMAG